MTEPTVRTPEGDRKALDRIAAMLADPDWGVGMLEDINDIVCGTGRNTDTEYLIAGPGFSSLFAFDDNDVAHPTAPIDPELDHEELHSPKNFVDQRAYWKQTGDALTDGYWTTRDGATVYTEDPSSRHVEGNWVTVPMPKDGEAEPISTWDRH